MANKTDRNIIQKIVELTIQGAASADNHQPWSFNWNGKRLAIREAIKGLKNTDPDRFLNTLNMGNMAEVINIVTSMPSINLQPEFSYSFDPDSLGMDVTFREASREPDVLVEGVEKRWCDRRKYLSGTISESVIKSFQHDLHEGINLHFSGNYDELNFNDAKIWSKVFMTDRRCKSDMYEWFRFSKRHAEKTRNGMYWITFRSSWTEARLLQLFMHPSWFAHTCARPLTNMVLRAIGILRRIFKKPQKSTPKTEVSGNSQVLGCVTVKDNSSASLVKAGRSVIRVWIRLNLNGYSFQPKMSFPLILSYLRKEGKGIPKLLKSTVSQQDAEEYLNIARKTFNINNGEMPVWIFRAGKPKGPRNYFSLRKEIKDVLTFS